MSKALIVSLLCLALIPFTVLGHSDSHEETPEGSHQAGVEEKIAAPEAAVPVPEAETPALESAPATGEAAPPAPPVPVQKERTWFGFYNLHPLVVHFPIVLLVTAFPLYLVGLLLGSTRLKGAAAIVALFGFVGAWVAAEIVHPHTAGLTVEMKRVLDRHELFASITLYSGAAAVLLAGLSLLPRARGTRLGTLAAAMLFLATLAVSVTGHYGSTLVHIHGIGPQGKYLEGGH